MSRPRNKPGAVAVAVVAQRVSEVAEAEVVPDSVKGECSECGQEVWLSPASQEVIKAHPEVVIVCVSDAYLYSGHDPVQMVTAETVEEVTEKAKSYAMARGLDPDSVRIHLPPELRPPEPAPDTGIKP